MSVEIAAKEETDLAVEEAITVLGSDGGFILSPVDNVRDDTQNTWTNTYRLIEAWKRWRGFFKNK